ncbi:MAG: pyrroloquinoline-quinone synthase PqqC [Deltaproteobacteria bacterium]|nr:MAG: pyrroloquinoline-quinone synthase PqqC [Deltaproteobacteria bacterium]
MSDPAAAFEARLRAILEERYHHRHPFNRRMHAGALTRDEIRAWVKSRYYYQTRIPIKDSAIVEKSSDAGFRRSWSERIHDHRGRRPGEGGLARWLDLAEAVGLDRAEVASLRDISPGVRRACDAYVAFVESHDLLESVASSLTELAAAEIMKVRIAAFETHYPWVDARGLRYFRDRTVQARRDAEQGMRFVLRHARGAADRERCAAALERKCEILWSLLDAVEALQRRPRLSKHAQPRFDDAGGESLVVLSERAVRVNPSGREILELCDGGRTAFELAAELRRRHPDAADVETTAYAFLDAMERLGVVEGRP